MIIFDNPPKYLCKIRDRRQEKGLSLRELAKKSGVSLSFLSVVERDLRKPSPFIADCIAEALGTHWSTLWPDMEKHDWLKKLVAKEVKP